MAPQLRSLRLDGCDICDEELGEVAKSLPNLEKLHIISMTVPKEVLESFGRCCPKLVSLTYNYLSWSSLVENADEALAIAQSMPGLRNLSLHANQMTNNGLNAILNRCPYLESLDLRQCKNMDFKSDFGRSCVQRIKNLKLPNDYLSDADDYDYHHYYDHDYDYDSDYN